MTENNSIRWLLVLVVFSPIILMGFLGYNFYRGQKTGSVDKKDNLLQQELEYVSGVRIVNPDLNNRQVSYMGKIVKREGNNFVVDVGGKPVDIRIGEEVLVRVLPVEVLLEGSFPVDQIINNLKVTEVKDLLVGEIVEILTTTDVDGKLEGILCDVYRGQE